MQLSPLRNNQLLSVWVLAYLHLVEFLRHRSSDIFLRSRHCPSIPFWRWITLDDVEMFPTCYDCCCNMSQTLSENMFIIIIDSVDHVCIFMQELHI